MTGSVWHEGEIALQDSVGLAAHMREIGARVIRDHMIAQHRDFYAMLPFVVLGTVDSEGDAWASLRAGAPGFLDARDPQHLHVALAPDAQDPAEPGLADGAAIGLLGIDLATKRRNRLNGVLRRKPDGFTVAVRQSFGNCPKYIRNRTLDVSEPSASPAPAPTVSTSLEAQARALIADADTFFVASYAEPANGERQVDVSHRGGPPGFVRVDEAGRLTIPDYAGNFFFNTLGNLLVNPRAGLVFADFKSGIVLQLTGDGEILGNTLDTSAEFPGAQRLWRFTPRRVLLRNNAWPLRFVKVG